MQKPSQGDAMNDGESSSIRLNSEGFFAPNDLLHNDSRSEILEFDEHH